MSSAMHSSISAKSQDFRAKQNNPKFADQNIDGWKFNSYPNKDNLIMKICLLNVERLFLNRSQMV